MAKKITSTIIDRQLSIGNPQPLRILMIEDSEDDALLIIRALKKGGYAPEYERVETAAAMLTSLKDKTWEIILSDYKMPHFSGPKAIALLKETDIDIPLIIVSGTIGEETAVECMRLGAHDYFIKSNLTRLPATIKRELAQAVSRAERRLAEQAVIASDFQYKELFENMSSCVAVYEAVAEGTDFIFRDFNRAAEKTDQISRKDVIGKSVLQVFPGVQEMGLLEVLQRAWRTGRPEHYPAIFYKDKRIEGWRDNDVYKLPTGQVVVIYDDITERKQAKLLEQLMSDVLNILNRTNNIQEMIRDILLLVKRSMGFEAIGIRLKEGDDYPYCQSHGFPEDFIKAENHLCAYDEAGGIIRDGQGNPVLECMCGNILCERFNPDLPFFTAGGSFWTNSTTKLLATTSEEDRQARTRNRCNGEGYESVALIPLRAGEEVFGLLQFNDHRPTQFTLKMIQFFESLGNSIGIALNRKHAAEHILKTLKELHESKDMLVQSEKLAAVGRLSAGVAHEILNPINIISMRLQLLEALGNMPDHFFDTLRICREQIDRVVKITKDLNQFSRIAATECIIMYLNELIKHILEMTAPRFKVDKVNTKLNLSEDLPAVSIDKNRIEQVFLNLINNAIDAMEGKENKTLSITTSKEEPEKGKTVIRIAVSDNGTGVKEEAINKIFDPFYTTKAAGKGTGLGLSITYGIIQDHKGRLWVEKNELGGATFIIELPVTG